MGEPETPQSLYDFFKELDPGDDAEEEDVAINYGSPAVLRRGLEAARKLKAIQDLLGVDPAAPSVEQGAAPAQEGPPASQRDESGETRAAELEELKEDLTEAEGEVDRLLLQNVELTDENKKLKSRSRLLQRQVERLYNKNEMERLLTDIKVNERKIEEREAAKADKEQTAARGAEADAEQKAPSESEAEANESEDKIEAAAESAEAPGDDTMEKVADDEADVDPSSLADAAPLTEEQKAADLEKTEADSEEIEASEKVSDSK